MEEQLNEQQLSSRERDAREPWANEPPVAQATSREETIAQIGHRVVEADRRQYVEQRTQLALQDAEKRLIEIEYDYQVAIEDLTAATLDYIEAESQQARTRVRVIEKLMAESEAAVGRKQNEAKRGETLSISAAEKIVSGHPEYTAVRDDVATKLQIKSEAENRRDGHLHAMLNMREIVQNRRAGFLIVQADGRIEAPFAPRSMNLRGDERSMIEQRDSRGLHGIERTVAPRERLVERGVPLGGGAAMTAAVHTDTREEQS